MSKKRLPATVCQFRLMLVWLIGGGGLLVILFVLNIQNLYGTADKTVWNWFAPFVVPTLALMLGVVGANATRDPSDETERTVDQAFYRIAMGFSAAYLGGLLVVIAASVSEPDIPSLERLLERTSLYITGAQGLVGLMIGVFFVKG